MIFLQFIFIIFVVILLFALFTVVGIVIRFWGVIRQLIGFAKPPQRRQQNPFGQSGPFGGQQRSRTSTEGQRTSSRSQSSYSSSSQQKKIFSADEGEYVDFEELD